ncbi:hypothetical protein EXS57_01030 [Candidatus Kaiserbacteria bacterium]|nr:hypothetical protein [Candidatus Kaiserbacteria bacterium]
MKKYSEELEVSAMRISLTDFLKSYNKTLPEGFPKASSALLKQFKNSHPLFFKHGDLWSLDEHRKKIIDWLPPRDQAF